MKRFYKHVTTAEVEGGWQVMLDGRGLKTQGKAAQRVPSQLLAEMLAEEWATQGEEIDPKSFIFRDLADYALDVIAADPTATINALLGFSQTDTLCYRAEPGEALYRKQEELWEPLLTVFEERHSISFTRVSGIIHDAQPDSVTEKITALLHEQDAFQLAGMQTMASLSDSIIIGFAGLEDGADAAALFDAANVEEDWQAELWGQDAEAEAARKMRAEAFALAMQFATAART